MRTRIRKRKFKEVIPTTSELFLTIAECCKRLGWAIVVPKTDNVRYLIIGEENIVEKISDAVEKANLKGTKR